MPNTLLTASRKYTHLDHIILEFFILYNTSQIEK